MSEKTVNYTDEMVARLHEVYDSNADEAIREQQIEQLASELGKNKASIRAKLTRERVYVAKSQASKAPASPRKAVIVSAIAQKLGVDEDVVGSLEKATKNTLIRVYNAL